MYFANYDDNIHFEYVQNLPINRQFYPLNKTVLHGYALYRKTIVHSYGANPNLAEDIHQFQALYNDSRGALHHYASNAALGAMQDWQDPEQNIKSYIAYDGDRMVGFVQFQEKAQAGQKFVYIANLVVENANQGVGTRLIQSVLAHYLVGTEFRIGTRVFNDPAIHLYRDKLKFTPLTADEVVVMGLDERYCGFRHTTTYQELVSINALRSTAPPRAKAALADPKLTPKIS